MQYFEHPRGGRLDKPCSCREGGKQCRRISELFLPRQQFSMFGVRAGKEVMTDVIIKTDICSLKVTGQK